MSDTTTVTAPAMAYIATVPGCGCMVACTVDVPEHARDTARELASWVRDGLTIERHTVEAVRAMRFRTCPHRVKARRNQPALFDESEVTAQ